VTCPSREKESEGLRRTVHRTGTTPRGEVRGPPRVTFVTFEAGGLGLAVPVLSPLVEFCDGAVEALKP
jgi:hypothetical protein